jgi:carboxyl-terminal processing protease
MSQRRFWSWLLVFSLGISLHFASFFAADSAIAAIVDPTQEQKFFNNVWQIVNRSYVDNTFNNQNWYKVRKQYNGRKLNSRDDTYDAIQEMLASLDDPFTRLLRPDQYRTMTTSTTGALTGVGLQIAIEVETKSLLVVSPIEGSPADKAGLRSLDRILSIDNTPTANLTLDECADRMRGEIGSEVTLTIARSEVIGEKSKEATFDVKIARGRIEVNPVLSKLNQEGDRKVGYVRLTQFNGNAASDMAKAIAKLEEQGADSYVLDLRGNPGGLLQGAVEIARQWLPEGVIVYTVDRNGIQENFAASGKPLTSDPLVILQDGGTASASEVLAGALHDNGRAKLLGTRTFGKGLIQSLFELDDGSGLAVTIAKYETPNHDDINRVGIKPDVEVKPIASVSRAQLGTKDDFQYQSALKLLVS